MALTATTKNQITALLAVLTDKGVQTSLRDAVGRTGQTNLTPLLADGFGNSLTPTQTTAVTTAIAAITTDLAAN